MDKLLMELKENKASISICNLYPGGTAHADDVRTITTSTQATEDQSEIIATRNGISFNESKTEVVLFSRKPSQSAFAISL